MADIAMLVAEEYERRIKNSRKSCGGDGGGGGGGGGSVAEEIGFVSSVSAIAMRAKKVIGEENIEIVNWVLEPKSQIGLAAINCLFSA